MKYRTIPIIKSFFQLRENYKKRGKLNRLEKTYYFFDSIYDYNDFLSSTKKEIRDEHSKALILFVKNHIPKVFEKIKDGK